MNKRQNLIMRILFSLFIGALGVIMVQHSLYSKPSFEVLENHIGFALIVAGVMGI